MCNISIEDKGHTKAKLLKFLAFRGIVSSLHTHRLYVLPGHLYLRNVFPDFFPEKNAVIQWFLHFLRDSRVLLLYGGLNASFFDGDLIHHYVEQVFYGNVDFNSISSSHVGGYKHAAGAG